jgi:hypothetical protein
MTVSSKQESIDGTTVGRDSRGTLNTASTWWDGYTLSCTSQLSAEWGDTEINDWVYLNLALVRDL